MKHQDVMDYGATGYGSRLVKFLKDHGLGVAARVMQDAAKGIDGLESLAKQQASIYQNAADSKKY